MGLKFVLSLAKLRGTSSFPAHQPQKCFRDVKMERFCMLALFSPCSSQIFSLIPPNVENPGLKCECSVGHLNLLSCHLTYL